MDISPDVNSGRAGYFLGKKKFASCMVIVHEDNRKERVRNIIIIAISSDI
jgi:hypothetical protein